MVNKTKTSHKVIVLTKEEVEKERSNAYNYLDMNRYNGRLK